MTDKKQMKKLFEQMKHFCIENSMTKKEALLFFLETLNHSINSRK